MIQRNEDAMKQPFKNSSKEIRQLFKSLVSRRNQRAALQSFDEMHILLSHLILFQSGEHDCHKNLCLPVVDGTAAKCYLKRLLLISKFLDIISREGDNECSPT